MVKVVVLVVVVVVVVVLNCRVCRYSLIQGCFMGSPLLLLLLCTPPYMKVFFGILKPI